MYGRYDVGSIAFIISSVYRIREVKVLRYSGGLYTVQFTDTKGAIRVRENRLYPTQSSAEAALPKKGS